MFDVKPGAVLPEPKSPAGRSPKYPFASLKVDGMFFVPDTTTKKFASYVSLQGRQLTDERGEHVKFSSQTATMRQDLQTDEWEPCKVGAPGARNGVLVKRVK